MGFTLINSYKNLIFNGSDSLEDIFQSLPDFYGIKELEEHLIEEINIEWSSIID
jgi:hypothetical protein